MKILLSLILFSIFAVLEAKIRHHKWDVEYQYKSPDCYKKLSITINGDTPGPTIYAEVGDTIVVDVKNKLHTENLAIHWHGIQQRDTPWSDGTDGVTQCPVLPGETFRYEFKADKAGTYLYHSHYGMQRSEGLYGLIRVALPVGQEEPYKYHDNSSIILNDWWHKSTYELTTGLSSIPMDWVGEPQSILINGRGEFECSLAPTKVCDASSSECTPYVLTVIPGQTYLLHIAGITSLSALNFQIEDHDMTVVEADGNYVKPFVVKNLTIYSGETYSVLFTANQNPTRNYWIAVNINARKPATPTGRGILNYKQNDRTSPPPTVAPAGPSWDDTTARLVQSQSLHAHPNYVTTPPATANREIILLNTQNTVNGRVKWAMNNVSFTLPETPYLVALKYNLEGVFDANPPPDSYDYKNYDIYSVAKYTNTTQSNSIYRLVYDSVVDIVLQNSNMMKAGHSETHPWHLHGYDFWVLGYGIGKFDPAVDKAKYNLVDPLMKNTVPLHDHGWTAIRFKANNPGVWAFHCHIESHFFMGMGVVFEVGVEKVGKLPKEIMGCGASKGLNWG